MANSSIKRVVSSASNRRTWTWSAWIKRCKVNASDEQILFLGRDGSFPEKLKFTNDKLEYDHDIAGTDYTVYTGDRVYRDVNGYYHIVIAKDTTQATETNRIKIWVNGEQQTLTEYQLGFPPQNYEGAINKNVTHWIGADGSSEFFDGLMSHVHFTDGTAYQASDFGSTDSVTGEWQINTSPNVNYGTNGFFIFKNGADRNGSNFTDRSGQGNDWVGGDNYPAIDYYQNPSNIIATMNPLANSKSNVGMLYGNTQITCTTNKGGATSTLAIPNNKGKIYVEDFLYTYATDNRFHFGIMPQEFQAADDPVAAANKMIGFSGYNGAIYANGGNVNAFYGQNLSNNIEAKLGMAVDLTSATKTIAFSVNGAWITGTNATSTDFANALKVDITSYLSISSHWHVAIGNGNSSGVAGIHRVNFGSGKWGRDDFSGTTYNPSVGDTGAIFQYPVPTGYTALSTKGLNL